MNDSELATAPVNALVYLRVSTARQATKNGEAEGYSIPAQREACVRKARELGADVVDEFVDAGASARSADRAELQRLLERVKVGDITYVIVHKLDRLSRSRIDDAQISLAFQMAGTTLVSTSEQIDDSPSGSLLHGIMATIAEHYSKNLSYEAKKGMAEKVRRGGTNGVAPLGYLNETRRIDGVEIRTVVFDEERAEHVRWAFEQYATENWSIARLRDTLEERGFKSRTTRKIVGKPLNASQVHRMLTNPYYKGQILFKGVIYPGAHEPLVDEVLWQQVQDILGKRRLAGDRSWRHTHYLKGSLKCGRCGAGLGYMTANGNGGTYEYFYCLAQYGKRNNCDLPHLPVYEVEEAIERQWATVRFTDEQVTEFSQRARDDLHRSAESGSRLITDQRRRLAALERQRQKLLDAYMAEALPMEVLKERQGVLTADISNAKRLMQSAQLSSDQMSSRLEQVVSLLINAERLYATVGDDARQILNTAVFEPFVVDLPNDGNTAAVTAQAPLSAVTGAVLATTGVPESPTKRTLTDLNVGEGSILTHLVREGGFEPPRPCGHWHLKPARLPFRHSRVGPDHMVRTAGRV